MAQNIILFGASYPDVPLIEVPKDGGGDASFVDISDTTATAAKVKANEKFYLANGSSAIGTYAWDFKGDEPEFIEQVYDSGDIALKDTTFKTWTPSTTAKAIKSSVTVKTFAADMVNYEYLLRWKCQFTAVYPEGTSMVAAPVREIADIWQCIYKRPNSLTNIAASNFNSNVCTTLMSVPLLDYYNASGSHTYTYAMTYGIYPGATAATFSNSTSNTPTVTIKTPTYNARCSTTYFDTSIAEVIDQTNSKFRFIGYLYRMQPRAALRQLYEGVVDLYNNPLT